MGTCISMTPFLHHGFLKFQWLPTLGYSYNFKLVNIRMRVKKQQPQITTKHYCCLYHFTNGKQAKSSTPCFNHVPLGVINPPPQSIARSPKCPPTDLQVQSKQHQINLQRISNTVIPMISMRSKTSRAYQKDSPIHECMQSRSTLGFQGKRQMLRLTSRISGRGQAFYYFQKDFHEIFLMFKRYAKLTAMKTQEAVLKHLFSFAKSRSITLGGDLVDGKRQYFFSHRQFINYLINCGFQQQQAQLFWEIAYNGNRFSSQPSIKNSNQEIISMRAFAYNYNKFYLQELQSYKNCLSQPALRQRMIDLRLFLQPWFTRNIIFKENHQYWKQIELMICTELKRYGENEVYHELLGLIQLRNKIWLFMRVLAKIFYTVTDQKNVGLAVFNAKATEFISKQRENLEAFVNLISSFETHIFQSGRSRDFNIKITELLHFAKINFPSFEPSIIVYLRALFKYLYFFKKSPLLSLNRQTLSLDCSGIAQISLNDLLEFVSFKQKEVNHVMDMIDLICREVNDCVDSRPQIQGFKKFINECNYLSMCLFKMVKRTDFTVFYRLQKVRELYQQGEVADIGRLKEILQQTDEKNKLITSQFWKKTFSFINIEHSKENTSASEIIEEKNYINALEEYELLSKRLQGRLPNAPQQVKVAHKQKKKDKEISKSRQSKRNLFNNKPVQTSQIQQLAKKANQSHTCSSAYCSLCDDICSSSVTSTINRIDSMSNYLFDLLNGI